MANPKSPSEAETLAELWNALTDPLSWAIPIAEGIDEQNIARMRTVDLRFTAFWPGAAPLSQWPLVWVDLLKKNSVQYARWRMQHRQTEVNQFSDKWLLLIVDPAPARMLDKIQGLSIATAQITARMRQDATVAWVGQFNNAVLYRPPDLFNPPWHGFPLFYMGFDFGATLVGGISEGS
jgi:hypothetical protein